MAGGKLFMVKRPAQQAKRVPKGLAKAVKKVMLKNSEVKHVSLQYGTATITNAPNFNLINAVAKGDDDFQRIGKNYKSLRIGVRGVIIPSTEVISRDNYNQVRLMVIYDAQPNGSAPTAGEILTYSSDLNSSRNPDYFRRFKILADKQYLVYNKASQHYAGAKVRLNIKAQLPTECDGPTGGIGDISTGAFWLFTMSDSSAADHPGYVVCTTFTYTDI